MDQSTGTNVVHQILGGAGEQEAAVIAALVGHLATEAAQAAATPVGRPRQSAWVLAWRPQPAMLPLPSHTYNAMPWAEVDLPGDPTT